MFKKGYNLCKAASLASIKKAGGQPYRAGIFDGRRLQLGAQGPEGRDHGLDHDEYLRSSG